MRRFRDRREAGARLADALRGFTGRHDVLLLALPRGGVQVAGEIARSLSLEMDVLVVRKIGVPWNPEFAVGALAAGGMFVLDDRLIEELGLDSAALAPVISAEARELNRREAAYRGDRQFPELAGKTVILVDDGLATGSTMEAAVRVVRSGKPAQIIVAVPVGSREACANLSRLADQVICLNIPDFFVGVGLWYLDFAPVSDDEVLQVLRELRPAVAI